MYVVFTITFRQLVITLLLVGFCSCHHIPVSETLVNTDVKLEM